MKLITLNTWGGRIAEPLSNFLTEKNKEIDFFCFQEMYHQAHGKDTMWLDTTNLDLLNDVKRILTEYHHLYHPHLGDWWGLSMHVKNNFKILESGEKYVWGTKGYDPDLELRGYTAKNVQYVILEDQKKTFAVINFHGLWNGQGKGDSEDRIEQTKNIIEFAKTLAHDFILCGDFNLLPDTKSIAMLEAFGLRNLIKEFGITSTRTSHYKKEPKFADYIFVTSGIVVKDFKVLPDEVSDHAPLYLDFE